MELVSSLSSLLPMCYPILRCDNDWLLCFVHQNMRRWRVIYIKGERILLGTQFQSFFAQWQIESQKKQQRGCRGGRAPTMGSSSHKSSRGFADGSERWSGARAAGGARGRRKWKLEPMRHTDRERFQWFSLIPMVFFQDWSTIPLICQFEAKRHTDRERSQWFSCRIDRIDLSISRWTVSVKSIHLCLEGKKWPYKREKRPLNSLAYAVEGKCWLQPPIDNQGSIICIKRMAKI